MRADAFQRERAQAAHVVGACRFGAEEPGDVERICRRGQEQPWCQMRAHFGLQCLRAPRARLRCGLRVLLRAELVWAYSGFL